MKNAVSCDSFPKGVIPELQYYVYRLIDPRNGETFYVGKGRGNRLFAHVRAEQNLEGDEHDNKLKRIWTIHNAGFEVTHVVHRHGMDATTATEVESALMDAYPGLTNIQGGFRGNERGAMHAREIIQRYAAKPAVFRHKALLICVNRSALDSSLYEATRYAWRIDPAKAKKAEVILATIQGVIRGAFVAEHWLEATSANFPGHEPVPGRFGFVGVEAPEEMKQPYLGKRIPEEYQKQGAANPIKYTWKK